MKHNVVVPSAGESITEVYIGDWHKKSGDVVKKDEILVDIESQKATFELQSEQSGRLEILKPQRDTVVKPGDVIATIDDSVTSAGTSASSAAVSKSDIKEEPILSPAARKIADEKNLNPATLKGTGKDGRITKEDAASANSSVSSAAASAPIATPIAPRPISTIVTAPAIAVNTERGERIQPATRIRKQIAQNLVAAQHTAAILTTFNEVDMSSILEFRKKHKEEFKTKYNVPLGIVSFFSLAAVRALKEFPIVNSTFTGEEIIARDFVDISLAVSTDRGLVVPVLRDVDKMSIVEFEKKLHELSERARLGKLSIPEMTGGTFTISNGGVFGSLLSTPILNMPQSAILGLHKTQERPMVINGKIEIRPMMYLALSYDHRLIDGREAVLFLVKIKEAIENLSLIINEKDL